MSLFTYGEMTLCMFVYSPIYVISVYFVTIVQRDTYDLLKAAVAEELHYFVAIQTTQNVNRAALMTIAMLTLKYLQQLDVCQLIIKKWTISKQEG